MATLLNYLLSCYLYSAYLVPVFIEVLSLRTLALLAPRLRMLLLGELPLLRLPDLGAPLSLLRMTLLLISLNLGSLLILFFSLISQFLYLFLWSGSIVLDAPTSFLLPISVSIPALPVLLKPVVRNSFRVPPVSVPIMISVVSSPFRVYIVIKKWNTAIIDPTPVIIT